MIRTLALSALAATLAGCSVTMTKPLYCDDSKIQGWIGQKHAPAAESTLKRKSYARTVRVVRPGDVTTMEFDRKRLTISVDDRNIITALRCG